MGTSLTLAEDVCARLCHDLGGPLGTLGGGLDLLDGDMGDLGGEALSVAREGADALRRRLTLWRSAVGGGTGPLGRGAMGDLLDGTLGGGRVSAELGGLGDAVLDAGVARAALVGAMLGAEALPRGGVVRIAGTPREVVILPEGRGSSWPPALTAALAGETVTGAREVLAPLLLALCAASGLRPALTSGQDGVAAPLMLSGR